MGDLDWVDSRRNGAGQRCTEGITSSSRVTIGSDKKLLFEGKGEWLGIVKHLVAALTHIQRDANKQRQRRRR